MHDCVYFVCVREREGEYVCIYLYVTICIWCPGMCSGVAGVGCVHDSESLHTIDSELEQEMLTRDSTE